MSAGFLPLTKLFSPPLTAPADRSSRSQRTGLYRFGAVCPRNTRLSPHKTRLTPSPPLGGQRYPLGPARTGSRLPSAAPAGPRRQEGKVPRPPARPPLRERRGPEVSEARRGAPGQDEGSGRRGNGWPAALPAPGHLRSPGSPRRYRATAASLAGPFPPSPPPPAGPPPPGRGRTSLPLPPLLTPDSPRGEVGRHFYWGPKGAGRPPSSARAEEERGEAARLVVKWRRAIPPRPGPLPVGCGKRSWVSHPETGRHGSAHACPAVRRAQREAAGPVRWKASELRKVSAPCTWMINAGSVPFSVFTRI